MTVLARPADRLLPGGEDDRPGTGRGPAGAGWVIPFDADEVWLADGHHAGAVAGRLRRRRGAGPRFNHVPTADDDPAEPDPVRRLRWRKTEPNRLHKVAFRAHRRARLHYGNHGVHRRGRRTGGLEIRHFPYRSEEQFVRKLRQGSATPWLTPTSPTRSASTGAAWARADDDGTARAVAEAGRDPQPAVGVVGAAARGSSRTPCPRGGSASRADAGTSPSAPPALDAPPRPPNTTTPATARAMPAVKAEGQYVHRDVSAPGGMRAWSITPAKCSSASGRPSMVACQPGTS